MSPTASDRWRSALQLLRVDKVRQVVALARFTYFVRLRGRLRTANNLSGVTDNTVNHNLRSLGDLAVNRSSLLVRPLSAIEVLDADSRILVIGPRTEGELLNLVGHGFSRRNIKGLDLISYSPWIELGNMHALPYADNSWDAIVMGWVLAYSDTPATAASEVIRVAKNGAIVAVGIEYNPMTQSEVAEQIGYSVGDPTRFVSVAEILQLFRPYVDRVYFAHDVPAGREDRVGAISTLFSISK